MPSYRKAKREPPATESPPAGVKDELARKPVTPDRTKEEDEYLDKNSAMFHAHLGYRLVGEFYDCGYKFGRWYNMVWMEKLIGEHI